MTDTLPTEAALRDLVLSSIVEGVVVQTATGEIVSCNPAAEKILGLTAAQMAGRDSIDPRWRSIDEHGNVLPGEDHPAMRVLRTGRPIHGAIMGVHRPNGELVWINVNSLPLEVGSDGLPVAVVSTFANITEARRHHDDALRAIRTLADSAPIGIFATNEIGATTYVNPACERICGLPRDEILSRGWATTIRAEDQHRVVDLWQRSAATGSEFVVETELVRPDGSSVWIRAGARRADDVERAPFAYIGVVEDITQERIAIDARQKVERRLRYLADHDDLTGLLNRRSFGEILTHHVERVHNHGPSGALMIIDLDSFKAVNDTMGHSAGDRVIIAVADALKNRLRREDFIARLGGDELAILTPSCAPEDVPGLASAVVELIRGVEVFLGSDVPKRITASVGVAIFDERTTSAEAAMAAADVAMYDAKNAGRDSYVIASPTDANSPVSSAITWLERIEHALENERLELHAQPIVSLETGAITKHELLVRMIDEDGTAIRPAPWMAVAERTGLVRRVDRWVCERAIEHLAENRLSAAAVNLSGLSLSDELVLSAIEKKLDAAGVDPARLTIEVTETAAISNLSAARSFVERLRALGCALALDDFGAGFGSFYYLKYLPFDHLKIDGEFVANCDTDPADQAIIRSIVDIARELGTEVTAERVQSQEVLETIKKLGVTHAQGYLLGRPAPLDSDPSKPGT